MVRTNQEIYNEAKKEVAHIMSAEQIAMNAMFVLRKELMKEYGPKDPDDEFDDDDGDVITVSVSDVNFFKK
jgi:hypothetical protein